MKYSKQRDVIERNLRGRCDHPTASMVYDSVRTELPDISLGTVYRNLNLLADTGVILRLPMLGGVDRYDGKIDEHYHVYCEKCHGVSDVNIKISRDLIKKIKEDTNMITIKNLNITGCGVCAKCECGENCTCGDDCMCDGEACECSK